MPRARRTDVLFVCTGNLCRSPMMQTVLSHALPELVVCSAGTAAPAGQQWHPLTVQVLDAAGYPVAGKARRLRKQHVRDAKLILTAEGAHRGYVVGLDHSAADRTYTLLEAARLLAELPARDHAGAGALALHLALALRMHPLDRDDDLADPLAGTEDDFRACLHAIQDALGPIAAAL